MDMIRISAAGLLAVIIAGCASLSGGPPPDVRQALAPSGKLRVALFDGNAVHVTRDPASGQMKGVSHDLGKEFAARLGVPFEPVLYPAFGPMLDAGKAGAWDVAFVGVSPERSAFLDFTGNHLAVEIGYLVPAGSGIAALEDVDRPGVRIAVVERGSPDTVLTRALKNATLVRVPGIPAAMELLNTRKADVIGALKPTLYGISPRIAGSRVLDGKPGVESSAMGIPKGRGASANAYARRFIEDAKAEGLVKSAIERSELRGVVAAPPEG